MMSKQRGVLWIHRRSIPLEYVLRVAVVEALQQAGVPANSAAAQKITDRVTKEVANGIEQECEPGGLFRCGLFRQASVVNNNRPGIAGAISYADISIW